MATSRSISEINDYVKLSIRPLMRRATRPIKYISAYSIATLKLGYKDTCATPPAKWMLDNTVTRQVAAKNTYTNDVVLG